MLRYAHSSSWPSSSLFVRVITMRCDRLTVAESQNSSYPKLIPCLLRCLKVAIGHATGFCSFDAQATAQKLLGTNLGHPVNRQPELWCRNSRLYSRDSRHDTRKFEKLSSGTVSGCQAEETRSIRNEWLWARS